MSHHAHSSNPTTRALLPTNVVPIKYDITLQPDFNNFTFKGTVAIDVDVRQSVSEIILHCFEIEVDASSVNLGGVGCTSVTYSKENETATFTFSQALKVGRSQLHINYTGHLNDKMVGFYRSQYDVTVNGKVEKRWMATTQFEATDARKAFPCWDEPAHKATFLITLVISPELNGLSNMPVISDKTEGGHRILKFQESPIMSTYLVAFIVGQFDYVEGKTKEGVIIRVYTPPGKKEKGRFALEVGIQVLSYYTDYFHIPYPLPKLDMIAIADFAAGAMENWGLVTYRETALLIDEGGSAVSQKQRVAYVVAHELAHQWFGNLVTMEWWKELWLNEGFATFIGNQAVDKLFPEWQIWTQFVSTYTNRAFDLDSLQNSHAIEVEVYNSAQINEIFDAISYNKGASVIRMIANEIGEEAFRKGLTLYLNTFKYKNAVTEDLWKALTESSGFDVKGFMDAYTKSVGFPLLSFEKHGHNHTITQARFLANGAETQSSNWWISAPSISADGNRFKIELKEKSKQITLPDSKWIKVNANQTGFFRVRYSSDLYDKLAANVTSLSIVDRLGLQNDAFALAKAGLLPTSEFLKLALAYDVETDYTVWSDLTTSLSAIESVWMQEPDHAKMMNYYQRLFTPIVNKLGFVPKANESPLDTMLRPIVIAQLAKSGDKQIVEQARKKFVEYQANPSSLPADLRYIVYKLVVAHGNKNDYDEVKKIYETAEMHEEKLRALRALCATSDPELMNKTLEMSLSPAVRSQDIYLVIASVSLNPNGGRLAAWNFMTSRWSDFLKALGDAHLLLGRTISLACKDFVTEEKAAEVEAFFQKHPTPQAERTIKQSLEEIRTSARWLARSRQDVSHFFQQTKF